MADQGKRAQLEFADEIASIESESIRDFVVNVFDMFGMPEWWARACSLTGKYHPLLAQNIGVEDGQAGGVGGLVRHVKFGVYYAKEFCRAYIGNGKKFTAEEQFYVDVIVASTILHDLMKDGDPTLADTFERRGGLGKKMISGCHGVDLANAIWNRMLGRKGTPEQVLICYGVAGHMGVWTTPAEYQPICFQNEQARFVSQMVHLADYTASRQSDIYSLGVMFKMGLISQEQWEKIVGYQKDRPRTVA